MKLENQVCTLEQARQLKGFGIIQKGMYSWMYDTLNERWDISGLQVEALDIIAKTNKMSREFYSAFTVSELATMLPINTSIMKGQKAFHVRVWFGNAIEGVLREQNATKFHHTESVIVAHALADMLIHLNDISQVTPTEVNARLQS